MALKFDRHLGSTAAQVFVLFQRDQNIFSPNFVISTFGEILYDILVDLKHASGFKYSWLQGMNN